MKTCDLICNTIKCSNLHGEIGFLRVKLEIPAVRFITFFYTNIYFFITLLATSLFRSIQDIDAFSVTSAV